MCLSMYGLSHTHTYAKKGQSCFEIKVHNQNNCHKANIQSFLFIFVSNQVIIWPFSRPFFAQFKRIFGQRRPLGTHKHTKSSNFSMLCCSLTCSMHLALKLACACQNVKKIIVSVEKSKCKTIPFKNHMFVIF